MSNRYIKAGKDCDSVRMMLAVCTYRDDDYWRMSELAQPPGERPHCHLRAWLFSESLFDIMQLSH